MQRRRVIWVVACLVVLVATGCAKRHVRGFYHVSHRQRYAITDAELRELQFYISKDVVVHSQQGAGGEPAAPVIILPKGTPGVVVDSGPDWLRVSFEKGGAGVHFVTDANRPEDLYWFATEVEGKTGFYKLSVLPRDVLLRDGQQYAVLEGADAVLYVDRKDLEELIKSRRHAAGQTRDGR
jgi:hypothetical protein